MSDLDLDRLEALADAATPGPWARLSPRSIESDAEHVGWPIVVDELNDGVGAGVIEDADAEFIAVSRSAVPALIARVRELEAVSTRIRNILDSDDQDDKRSVEYLDPKARSLQIANRTISRIEAALSPSLVGGHDEERGEDAVPGD